MKRRMTRSTSPCRCISMRRSLMTMDEPGARRDSHASASATLSSSKPAARARAATYAASDASAALCQSLEGEDVAGSAVEARAAAEVVADRRLDIGRKPPAEALHEGSHDGFRLLVQRGRRHGCVCLKGEGIDGR